MRRFSYKAVTPDGKVLQGETEAATREAVIDRLRGQGAIPIRAEECQQRDHQEESAELVAALGASQADLRMKTHIVRPTGQLATL